MLHLKNDVVVELAVERPEVVERGPGAIVPGIAPVHVMVVHEASVEQDAAVRRQFQFIQTAF